MPIRVVTKEVRYTHKLSLILEHSMPMSSPASLGLTVGVLELGAIVASYSLDLGFKLVLGSFCKFLESFLYYTFVMQKEYPSETRIIINNDKTIFVITNANIRHRAKKIHM